jgi:regulator of sirC expression with transglutaminase-like and TPR domain
MVSKTEFSNLVALLDDTDSDVAAAVEQRIMQQGKSVLPLLEDALTRRHSKETKQRIVEFIERLHETTALHSLTEWLASDGSDILRGMYCIATFIFPDIDFRKVCKQYDKLAAATAKKITAPNDALHKIKIINHTLFKGYKFTNNYLLDYDTTGYFLHLVIEQRQINPFSLGLLYLWLGKRLNIPMQLVELPDSFLIHCDERFYINPLMDGDIFGIQDLSPYPALPIKSKDEENWGRHPDSKMIIYHMTNALREAYDSDNKLALMQRITPATKLIAEKMEL